MRGPMDVLVAGVFQLSHSFSNRSTLQEKPDPQFSPIQFHEGDYVETLTL
jgi:hypothetical protein